MAQELVKAEQRLGQQRLMAPVDGVVQQLAVHTVGGGVTPAQQLMVIVPQETRLEIEAMVLNRDIGFVAAGQTAEIKIETFAFTKYGLIDGRVVTVSSDAIQNDKLGLVYATRIAMDRTTMRVNDKLVNLSPGMGGDGRDQDRHAAVDRISAGAAAALQAGRFGGEIAVLMH